tara:strand:+ start:833 stop:2524 length:1692 start_codon:yes stop_codon:yes gene_type:complete
MDNVKEKIAIASDHAGYQLKEKIKLNLEDNGYGVLDLGTNSEEAVDYPDYGKSLAQNILKGNVKRGIALCGTGIGISIAANRYSGIRAALCNNEEMAIQARKHNNANIIALGARSIDFQCASKCVDAFLNTDFEGERHTNRVNKIEKEPKYTNDKDLENAVYNEFNRQKNTIELIASENFASKNVMRYQGSVLTNKYAEGYPGKRYYGGCEFVDVAENLAINRLKQLFGCKWANVQPNSGSQANQAVFLALLKPGDTILGMSLSAGGHLTHGAGPNQSGKYFNSVHYGVKKNDGKIDYNEVRLLSKKHRPKLIIAGASAYSSKIDFRLFREIADEVGAYLLVDMAHYSGLIASKVYPDPVPFADVCTSTTHKTLRGPRGGIIISNNEDLGNLIDKAVFPGLQGGPLMHVIAAKAAAFKEALSDDFIKYSKQTLLNAKAICSSLKNNNFQIISGETSCHMLLINLNNKQVTGKVAEKALDDAGITCNKNSIPFDNKSPFVTSGIRIGTAAGTTRGFKEKEFEYIGNMISEVIDSLKKSDGEVLKTAELVRGKVLELCNKFPLYY